MSPTDFLEDIYDNYGCRQLVVELKNVFEETAMPSNSDVLLIVSQYLSALEKLRSDNIWMDPGGEWYWELEGKSSQDARYRTGPPRKIAE